MGTSGFGAGSSVCHDQRVWRHCSSRNRPLKALEAPLSAVAKLSSMGLGGSKDKKPKPKPQITEKVRTRLCESLFSHVPKCSRAGSGGTGPEECQGSAAALPEEA
eukprot:scaffold3928_cov257-Pinguiococcus_pyrenoidosus.AAC.4